MNIMTVKNSQGLSLLIIMLLLGGCAKPSQQKSDVNDLLVQHDNDPASSIESHTQSYALQVVTAIQSQISDLGRFKGKECTLTIIMAPDGMLLSARTKSGDSGLCRAVLQDMPGVRLPRAPSPEVYKAFIEMNIDFKI